MRFKLHRLLGVFLVLGLCLAPASTVFGRSAGQDAEPPLTVQTGQTKVEIIGLDSPYAIPDHYIVVFREGTPESAIQAVTTAVAQANGVSVTERYSSAILGFAAVIPAATLKTLLTNPNILYIEADQTVTLFGATATTQINAPWGLDRIDQRNRPLNGTYTYLLTGAGVRAYVIDTGIRRTHTEFGGRAVSGFTSINDGRGTDDCNGHGTHVAGTIGGTTYGVAKRVTLVAVRVLSCTGSGTIAGVIAGINWVTQNRIRPAVANMSLGGGLSPTLDTAVRNSIAAGVTYVVASGSSNASACNNSPANVAQAITVGASTSADARTSFSNFGPCLDLFAPGQSITSAWSTSDTATSTLSGTSMATSHGSGAAVLYLQGSPAALPAAVASALVNNATPNVLTGIGAGSPNRLLFTTFGSNTP